MLPVLWTWHAKAIVQLAGWKMGAQKKKDHWVRRYVRGGSAQKLDWLVVEEIAQLDMALCANLGGPGLCGAECLLGGRTAHRASSGAARTELESQLQRAVKVSAKGKHVKRKLPLLQPAGNRVPRPTEFLRRKGRALVEARHVWLMGRQWGVLCEARRLMLHAGSPRGAARHPWRPRTDGAA